MPVSAERNLPADLFAKPALIAIAFCILLFALLEPKNAVAQDVTVSIVDTEAAAGTAVQVPVRAEGFEAVGAISLVITYDPETLSFPEGAETEDLIKGARRESFNASVPEKGELRISWFDGTGGSNPIDFGEGVLLRLTFSEFAGGESEVAFGEGSEIADSEATPVETDFQNGVVQEIGDSSLLINEVLYDVPDGETGDANEDGVRDASEDQFVEIYNPSTSKTVDLSGLEIGDASQTEHVFPEGPPLEPEETVVVFGGGNPAKALPGLVQTASSGGLSLSADGGEVVVGDPNGSEILSLSYTGSVEGESTTRDPDFTGDFVGHTAANPNRHFSPGRTTAGSPLPVELSAFKGEAVGKGAVRLIWQTASERNNAGFDVQHQPPSSATWQTLGFVESKAPGGTTTDPDDRWDYQYAEKNLTVGTHRFRIRQVDLDGSATLTEPITVELQMKKALRLTAPSPNPVSGAATLSFAVKKEARATVAVYNVLGQQVKTPYEGTPMSGEGQRLRLDTSGLSSGTYFLRLNAGGTTRTRRLTVVR